MNDLWRLTAAELARLIRTRQVSATEAARAALERLDAVNPHINAVVDHRPDEVLARAADVDAALGRGAAPGVLAGVPITVKVNVDQAGYATTNGVRLQKDLIARTNSPVVDNLLRAGAVILGRTNTPAFSLRWFTSNLLHGATRNPRNAALTPGGSSGGAAAAVASGIGHLAHGTDIAGSIRYPAYACGVHGLRPSLGRVPAYNASLPERLLGAQLTAVSGPLGRTVADLRLGLAAMAAADPRDPWWVPAAQHGPEATRRAAVCLHPDGLETAAPVARALMNAAQGLMQAGWSVTFIDQTPGLRVPAELQIRMWMGDNYAAMVDAAEREGDPGARAALAGQKAAIQGLDLAAYQALLAKRATFVRDWQLFFAEYDVLLIPTSAELPFADNLDLAGPDAYARVWAAQMTQIGIPFMGLPALAVAVGMEGASPMGVQVVAGRFREDLCLLAGEAIEATAAPLQIAEPL